MLEPATADAGCMTDAPPQTAETAAQTLEFVAVAASPQPAGTAPVEPPSELHRVSVDLAATASAPPAPPGGWAASVTSQIQQGVDAVAPIGQFVGARDGVST